MIKIIAFILFSLTTPLCGGVVNDGLKSLSPEDRNYLNEFVKINLQWNQILHVIYFDNKPSSLCSAFMKPSEGDYNNLLFLKGYDVFRKNEHLFPHPNFIFISDICGIDHDEDRALNFYIINKKGLAKCFDQHFTVFQSILGPHCSFAWLIAELEAKKSVQKVFKNNQVLLGLLLGYGKDSSIEFHKHCRRHYSDDLLLRLDVYSANSPKTPAHCPFFPVVFMGNPQSEEVRKLLSIYENEMDEFWKVYQDKDALIFFFECICSEENKNLETVYKKPRSFTEFSNHVLCQPFVIN